MYPADAVKFFGSRKALAEVCEVSDVAVHHWFRRGFIPYDKQCLIQLAASKKVNGKKVPVANRKHARKPAEAIAG